MRVVVVPAVARVAPVPGQVGVRGGGGGRGGAHRVGGVAVRVEGPGRLVHVGHGAPVRKNEKGNKYFIKICKFLGRCFRDQSDAAEVTAKGDREGFQLLQLLWVEIEPQTPLVLLLVACSFHSHSPKKTLN